MRTQWEVERPGRLREPAAVAVGRYLSTAWRVLSEDFLNWILLSLIYFAVLSVVGTMGIAVLVVAGPLEAGWYAVVLKRLRRGTMDIGEFVRGFHLFVPSFLIGVTVGVLASFGFILLILPGLLVLTLYLFAFPILVDRGGDFWGAMEASRKAVLSNLFEWSVFVFVQLVLVTLGALFCGVGLLIALPWTKIATAVAYEEHFLPASSAEA